MDTKIITISRQCGSGGHLIGEIVARELGIPFYDKALVKEVANRSGFSEEVIESKGEDIRRSFLFNIAPYGFSPANTDTRERLPLSDQIHAYQTEVIRDLSEKGPCVIVGRCADYILRHRDDVLHVFIYGKFEDRVARVIRTHEVAAEEASAHVTERDKKRARYYKQMTNRTWAEAYNYNLCLDVSWLGIRRCADMVVQAYRAGHTEGVDPLDYLPE